MDTLYGISNYRADIAAANARYDDVIRTGCVSEYGVIPLSPDEIYTLKNHAMGVKSQLFSAAGKRLRASVALRLLDRLSGELDLTATLATRITQRLLGRAINRTILLDRYGTESRTARDKSADFSRLDEIEQSASFIEAMTELAELLTVAEKVRSDLKKEAMQKGRTKAQHLLSESAKAYY